MTNTNYDNYRNYMASRNPDYFRLGPSWYPYKFQEEPKKKVYNIWTITAGLLLAFAIIVYAHS